MTPLDIEEQIRDNVETLCRNGMAINALDLLQELGAAVQRQVSIGRMQKSSYRARKDGDWQDLERLIDEMAEIVRVCPTKWREPAFDRFVDLVYRGESDVEADSS